MEAVPRLARHVRDELGRVIVGQHELKTQCLIVLLCDGHALLEGVPGIAKTLTVKALARLLGLDFQRVQCTSDLMPADIVGTNVANLSTGTFQLHKGPAFTDLLLVDEVNRMPPRTQAALLECMEERQITIDGVRHDLSSLFTVFATQNPIDFEGTYPLPEAQLDRFFAKIRVPYPSAEEETQLLINVQQGFDSRHLDALGITAMPPVWLSEARQELARVAVERSLFDYIVRLVRLTREWPPLSLGASPRAAMSVTRFAKAVAALDGRDYVIPDDVKQAFLPVLRHRVIVKAEADLEGLTADQSLDDVLKAVEVPK
jgi:MoxR-like ATPase